MLLYSPTVMRRLTLAVKQLRARLVALPRARRRVGDARHQLPVGGISASHPMLRQALPLQASRRDALQTAARAAAVYRS
jgi:hypothetical protein